MRNTVGQGVDDQEAAMTQRASRLWLSIVLFGLVGAFALIMTTLSHNEHMYVTAGVLVSHGRVLYKDFAYVQAPYLPLLYAGVYKLLNATSYYYLVAKFISFLFTALSAAILYLVARRVVRDAASSFIVVALFLLNMSIIMPAREASNYIMPLALSFASYYAYIVSVRRDRISPSGVVLSGLFLAVAIGAKLTYASLVVPFVATPVLCPLNDRSAVTVRRGIVYVVLPFLAGLAIGLLPVAFFLSKPDSFVFNNLGYHSVNAGWRRITGYSAPMSLLSKLVYARQVFFEADNLVVVLGVLLGLGLSVESLRDIRQALRRLPHGAILAFLLVLVGVPTALAPTPSFPQYFAMPVSFLFPLLLYSCAGMGHGTSRALCGKILTVMVLVCLVYNGPILGRALTRLARRDGWSALHVHDASIAIRNAVMKGGPGRGSKIATLSPLFAVESNLPIYRQLSTGPFLYRVGDLLTPAQRRRYIGTSASSIGNLLDSDPPGAVLVGFERDLDGPLLEYARSNGYAPVDVPRLGGELYVRR